MAFSNLVAPSAAAAAPAPWPALAPWPLLRNRDGCPSAGPHCAASPPGLETGAPPRRGGGRDPPCVGVALD
eukprot:3764047-Pyramimonas_sp.AAC.1